MRTYKRLQVLAVASVLATGFAIQACTDLDSEIFDQAEASKFPRTEAELRSTVGATYAELRGFLDPVLIFLEATTDELVVPTRGPNWYDNAAWQQMARHEWTSVSPSQVNGSWEWAYRVIANANLNLITLSTSELQIEGKDVLVAEVRMLRAFAYFWLLDMYGNVPIITEETPPGNPPQNSRAEVFAFVEKEIQEALPTLEEGNSLELYGRFTKAAANTLLAKLYLNAEVYTGTPRWQDVITATDAVINSTVGYGLNPSFLGNFKVNNGNDPTTYVENIFTIPYDRILAGGMNWQMRTLHYAHGPVYGLNTNPWNGFATRAEFYNLFSDDDERKSMWLVGPQRDNTGNIITFTDVVDNRNKELIITPEITSLERAFENEGVRSVKYEVQPNNSRTDQDNDFVVFRYADVLLMKAEALLRTGDTGAALELVNQVRERSEAGPLGSITLDELLNERGREFAWEGWRRNDLIRFGRYTQDTWQFKTNTEPFRALFPIPAQQLANNPNLTQNPGY